MTRKQIVVFTGPSGAGKSTAARYLVSEHNFTRVSLADPLKSMLRALGLTNAQLYGDQKEVPTPLLGGATPRYAMQTLGTEWGRQMISDTLWTDAWARKVDTPGTPRRIVVDDARFPNEVAMLRTCGAYTVEVRRPGHEYSDEHVSEAGVNTDLNYVIHNWGPLEVLRAAADDVVRQARFQATL